MYNKRDSSHVTQSQFDYKNAQYIHSLQHVYFIAINTIFIRNATRAELDYPLSLSDPLIINYWLHCFRRKPKRSLS